MMRIPQSPLLQATLTSATLLFSLVFSQAALAGTLHNGWNYAIDPSYDSLASDGGNGLLIGGTIYEIYGMAIKDDVQNNRIWVGLNANLPIGGNNVGDTVGGYRISNGNIGWGDLFFDFSGLGNFKAANDSASLFGIRFAGTNDSYVPTIGVYENVQATSVVHLNGGWSNLGNHNIYGIQEHLGLEAAMGDLAWNDPYYAPYTTPGLYSQPHTLVPNVIATGNRIGDITLVNSTELAAAGFDLGYLPATGSETFGFWFEKSLLPAGNFYSTLFLECNNDAIALVGDLVASKETPEPSTLVGFGVLAGLTWTTRKKRRKLPAML
ncbi:MAG: PEP-CTERM sorting domain-containing protein [Desertifilum sp. SIO1I2]|nr:PEP-CTERM sorting domain-containing protein [Desertifilum sp. SIO1I2]